MPVPAGSLAATLLYVKPKTLILRTAGTNCDAETQHAFELAGATVEKLHLNRVLADPSLLNDYQLLALPGGFSYGDDIAAGKILASQIVHHLNEPLRRFIEAGKPIIGICNGFQVLVKTDLLPGALAGATGQTATLTHNNTGRFICRWVRVKPVGQHCIWTHGIDELELPIAHGEGQFMPGSAAVRQALKDNDQIALVYADENPNGSTDDIAGVCDASGLVFGLMPHPERFVSQQQHPAWSSRKSSDTEGAGLAMFKNAVRHVSQAVGAGV
jgi:phosphoribosylformylglycinamidine synthase subunit PurQ / glutaminase